MKTYKVKVKLQTNIDVSATSKEESIEKVKKLIKDCVNEKTFEALKSLLIECSEIKYTSKLIKKEHR